MLPWRTVTLFIFLGIFIGAWVGTMVTGSLMSQTIKQLQEREKANATIRERADARYFITGCSHCGYLIAVSRERLLPVDH